MSFLPARILPDPINQTLQLRPQHSLTRSFTDFTPSTSSMLHLSNREPHSHHHHHHHRPHLHKSHKEAERPTDSSKSEGTIDSKEDTNGTPGAQSQGQNDPRPKPTAGVPGLLRERRPVSDEELKEERERDVLRASELKKSLDELNDLSNDTTRRLDNTYYSVLEKLSALQNTITSLHELATMSRGLKDDFAREGKEVISDLQGQLEGFNEFEEQQKKIADLESKIQKGREKIKKLDVRVDAVQERVVVWEAREGKWQQRMRYRMKILWIGLSVTAVLLLLFGLYRYAPSSQQRRVTFSSFNNSSLSVEAPDIKQTVQEERVLSKEKVANALESLRHDGSEKLEDNKVIRAFDEL